ncbi:dTDP-4-dehydrorhamnose reductase [Micromonospora mirobrigensis]|uniref:dTDP-4-dehydrorhamnose reductase n=1 Tax=Micromonospora mirobrigensis TaxID=262898 RepID=A0A1C4WY85_9ACTN|nr:dTDP-4-dehydrorhamnose reductase [Micromonospora mirobrigensis]SCF01138.1 dTDP-4-dehydrorhamnose reductase [Micromonospora mirobrigensis]
MREPAAGDRPTTRLLVTGAGGLLGRELRTVLAARPDLTVTAATRADLDVTDAAAVRAAVAGHDAVFNAAAFTDVDAAERQERTATEVNGHAVAHLARACAETGARLLHVSTDYVFAGDTDRPYAESAPPAPINAYGRSKLAGELAVARLLPDAGWVVRTAWLQSARGPSFVTTILRLAERQEQLHVVDDQYGQPTWARALARQLVALLDAALAGRAAPGVYHGTCAGRSSWHELAREVFALRGLDPDRVRPMPRSRLADRAPRPACTVLGHDRWAEAGLPALPHWRVSLAEAAADAGWSPGLR